MKGIDPNVTESAKHRSSRLTRSCVSACLVTVHQSSDQRRPTNVPLLRNRSADEIKDPRNNFYQVTIRCKTDNAHQPTGSWRANSVNSSGQLSEVVPFLLLLLGLPSEVTSASSLSVFKNRLKTYLFRRCYETV